MSLSRVQANKLKKLYYDYKHPAGYSSIKTLSLYSKINKNKVKQWLETQPIYSLFKPYKKLKRNTNFLPIIGYGNNYCHQADLIDISRLSKWNERIRFLLTLIDIFSKKAFVIPLKNKFGKTIMNALNLVYRRKINIPQHFHSDAGREFKNQYVENYLKSKKIKYWVSTSPYKAAICERFNRTLQMKLYKIMKYKKTKTYLPFLQDIVQTYNNSIHHSHGMRPNQITVRDFHKVFSKLYDNRLNKAYQFQVHFKVGDNCRLVNNIKLFRKGFLPTFSDDIYCIISIDYKTKPVTYKLVSEDGVILPGKFYDNELSRYRDKYIFLN